MSLLPWVPALLAVIVLVIWVALLRPRRYRRLVEEQERHIARANEHMERVEGSLQRLITLLEELASRSRKVE